MRLVWKTWSSLLLFHPAPKWREHWHSYIFNVKTHFCPLCAGQVVQKDLSPLTAACEGSRSGSQPPNKVMVGSRDWGRHRNAPARAPHHTCWAGARGWQGKLVSGTDEDPSALCRRSLTHTAVPLLASMTNSAVTHWDLSALWRDSWQWEFLSQKSIFAGVLQVINWNLILLSVCLLCMLWSV